MVGGCVVRAMDEGRRMKEGLLLGRGGGAARVYVGGAWRGTSSLSLALPFACPTTSEAKANKLRPAGLTAPACLSQAWDGRRGREGLQVRGIAAVRGSWLVCSWHSLLSCPFACSGRHHSDWWIGGRRAMLAKRLASEHIDTGVCTTRIPAVLPTPKSSTTARFCRANTKKVGCYKLHYPASSR